LQKNVGTGISKTEALNTLTSRSYRGMFQMASKALQLSYFLGDL